MCWLTPNSSTWVAEPKGFVVSEASMGYKTSLKQVCTTEWDPIRKLANFITMCKLQSLNAEFMIYFSNNNYLCSLDKSPNSLDYKSPNTLDFGLLVSKDTNRTHLSGL